MPSTPDPRNQTIKVASFKIPPADYERLERVAAREDRSVSAIVRIAVRRYLDDAEDARAA